MKYGGFCRKAAASGRTVASSASAMSLVTYSRRGTEVTLPTSKPLPGRSATAFRRRCGAGPSGQAGCGGSPAHPPCIGGGPCVRSGTGYARLGRTRAALRRGPSVQVVPIRRLLSHRRHRDGPRPGCPWTP
jgi:hypothetical protein